MVFFLIFVIKYLAGFIYGGVCFDAQSDGLMAAVTVAGVCEAAGLSA